MVASKGDCTEWGKKFNKGHGLGRLILLNMPIGDLSDLSARVVEALRVGEHFAVEDTRTFRETLARLGIPQEKHVLSLHDHSSEAKWARLLETVEQGGDLYVCSEAGSPVLSDPAFPLVRLAHEKNLAVETYSGISAVTAALELSGLPPIPFSFHGFLGRDDGKIKDDLGHLGAGTHLFFESPARIKHTIALCAELYPEALVAVVKEITKPFQKVWRFRASEHHEKLADVVEKGEFVWLVHFASDPRPRVPGRVQQLAQEILSEGVGNKALSQLLGEILDRPPKEIYAELGAHKLR